jgi:opacity protein-like surface antigen
MKRLLTGAAMLVLFAAPAFAQSPSSPSQPGMQSSTTSTSSQTLAASQKIKQDLQSAGFTDVKVVAESFVVQAKSRDGEPVLMTIGPRGMSVFEAVNDKQSASGKSTTGSAVSNSAGSGSQDNGSSQKK